MKPLTKFFHQNHRLLITLASATFIITGSAIAIQYAKGYRPTTQGTIQGTGLLAANSEPKGARIFIDGGQTGKVTDETIILKPGDYQVEFKMEGFTTWQKTLKVDAELVTDTQAHLFRTVPTLSPLTFSGAVNLHPSPDGQKIAFAVASPSAQVKGGLYVTELSDRPTLFGKSPKLVAENPIGADFKKASILWSPDSTQIIANLNNRNYLLDPTETTRARNLVDQSTQLPLLFSTWEEEILRRDKQLLSTLPEELFQILNQSAKNLYFSPNGEKLLYTATASATIPENLIPPLPATNSQPESRTLQPQKTYIYDLKEDKNFLVYSHPAELPEIEFQKPTLVQDLNQTELFTSETQATSSATPILQSPVSILTTFDNFRAQYNSFPFLPYQWFPTSKHILLNTGTAIQILEYDNTNLTTLYQGSFEDDFFYPWPGGNKLIILGNLTGNPDIPANLYTINLK